MATPRGAIETLQRAGTRPASKTGAASPAGAPSQASPGRAGVWRRQLVLNGWRLLLSVVLLAAWEVAATTVTTPFWISQPSRVFERLVSLATSGLLFWHVWATLQAALLGLALGGVVGVALGLLLGAYPRIAAIVDPLLMGLNSLPRVALAPLFIIWFGIGLPSKVMLAFSLVVFPVLINAYQGVRGVDRDLVDMLRTMQASPWQIARRVTIPSTLPWIFAGLRIGLGMGLIGAVVGELVGSSRGVGYYVESAAANFDTTGVFAGLVILMILTIALSELMKLVETRLFRWRPPETRG
jgi:NitT/TauT family transport system permease protein